MFTEFLISNRDVLIARCREKVSRRPSPRPTAEELQFGIPLFLDQLIETLELERAASSSESVSGPLEPEKAPAQTDIGRAAAKHGNELLRKGLTVDQVVHDYGDLCQAITELATELDSLITAAEFRTLNRCLDNAIADAVTEFSHQRDILVLSDAADASTERLAVLAHEMRNLLNSAMLAVSVIRAGRVGMAGATAQVLDDAHAGLKTLIDRSLEEVHLRGGLTRPLERIDVAQFIRQVQAAAQLEAANRGFRLSVETVEAGIFIEADRQLLSAAVGNLLQNAFKFSKHNGVVSLTANAASDRLLIEVQDQCGGLPPGPVEELFKPFVQRGGDRTGLGLGLSISQQSIEAINGTLSARDIPGSGCVFTIDLPRA